MINESTCTDPICAEHNGHYVFPQVLFLYPIEYLSSCQSFFCIDPHIMQRTWTLPSFLRLPTLGFFHQGHGVGKDCF